MSFKSDKAVVLAEEIVKAAGPQGMKKTEFWAALEAKNLNPGKEHPDKRGQIVFTAGLHSKGDHYVHKMFVKKEKVAAPGGGQHEFEDVTVSVEGPAVSATFKKVKKVIIITGCLVAAITGGVLFFS